MPAVSLAGNPRGVVAGTARAGEDFGPLVPILGCSVWPCQALPGERLAVLRCICGPSGVSCVDTATTHSAPQPGQRTGPEGCFHEVLQPIPARKLLG